MALPHGANTWLPLQDGAWKVRFLFFFLTSVWTQLPTKNITTTSFKCSKTALKPAKITFDLFISKFQNNEKIHPSIYPSVRCSSSLGTWISNLPCGVLGVPSGVAFQTQDPAVRPALRRCFFRGSTWQVLPFLPGNMEVKKQVPPIAVPFQIHSNTASFHSHDYGRKSNPRNGFVFFVGRFAMRKPSDSNTGHRRLILITDRMEG